jgi:hypothetical protein
MMNNERLKELEDKAWTMVSDEELARGELYGAREQSNRRDAVLAELIAKEIE